MAKLTFMSIGLVTKSDRMMKALDDRGAGGLVRGASSLAKSADGYLKPAPKVSGLYCTLSPAS